MPIHLSWGNEAKTFTYFRFENGWTWAEYHRAMADANDMVKGYPYTVNTLVDVSQCRMFPQNLLSNVRSSMQQPMRESDLVVIVTTSRFIEMLVRTLEKLYERRKMQFQLVRSADEGRALLEEHDRLHGFRMLPQAAASELAPAPAEPTSLPE